MAYMPFEGPGFTMDMPTNWLMNGSVQYQVMFVGTPQGGTEVRPNLMVTIRPSTDGSPLSKIVHETRRVQQAEYPQFALVDEVDYTQDGGAAYWQRYSWFHPDRQVGLDQQQCFFLYGNVLFTLTATRLQGDAPDLDATFDHMIQSFRITP